MMGVVPFGNRRMRRRDALRTAAAACAAPYVIPATVLGAPGRPGANDRIRTGLIGAGFGARDLLAESPPELQLVSIADCDLRQIDECLGVVTKTDHSIVAQDCSRYQDYRQMLAHEKLDAVFVATPTHARTLICLAAMQAGLDVYAEKPLTLTIEEGQYLVRAEKAYGRICQTGTQQRSIAINNFGSDLVRNGAIGKVHTVRCPNFPGTAAASGAADCSDATRNGLGVVVQPDGRDSFQSGIAPRLGQVGALSRVLWLARDRLGPCLRSDPARTGDR